MQKGAATSPKRTRSQTCVEEILGWLLPPVPPSTAPPLRSLLPCLQPGSEPCQPPFPDTHTPYQREWAVPLTGSTPGARDPTPAPHPHQPRQLTRRGNARCLTHNHQPSQLPTV